MKPVDISTLDKLVCQEQLESGVGFVTARMENDELARIKTQVFEQYLHTIQCHASGPIVADYAGKSMEDYHSVYRDAHFEHAKVWNKRTRVLGPFATEQIMSLPFFAKLCDLFGQLRISDEECFGWPNVYWRLVRPGRQDVGPVHADAWFWELGHGTMPEGYYRVKVWIALETELGLSGLRVLPGSQKKDDWRYHAERKNGQMKPVIDEDESSLAMENLNLNPGEMVIFHDRLLHGGMPNLSSKTRASLEFTMLVPVTT